MITAFDRIIIEVENIQSAVSQYSALLGPLEIYADCARLVLANICIELHEKPSKTGAQISGLALLDDELREEQQTSIAVDTRGLQLSCSGFRNGLNSVSSTPTPTGITAVDHLVIQTNDADDCIRLFGENGLGLRLALDQQVPEWGGRMVFFRMGKMTLELIQNLKEPPPQDFFWGITYLCTNIDATVSLLDEAGVEHSSIREGRKPGTRVATIKSHCLGLPTLLISPE